MEIVRGNGPTGMATRLDETLRGEVDGLTETLALYEAHITQLEQALLEPGWQRMSAMGEQEFTRDGLRAIAALCRLMALKNPLLRRAVAVSIYYVFGQGVTVAGKDDQVAEVVTELVDDPGNQRVLFGHAAQAECERSLRTDANLFLALFTNPRTGRVQVRDLPFDEINDVICDPEDRSTPWFYERHWAEVRQDGPGLASSSQLRKAMYPDVDFQPAQRPASFGGVPVRWDAPVVHVHVNRPRGHRFGVPELYPALDWARAHAEFLDDFRRLVKVLAKLAWALTGVKGSRLEQAKAAAAQATAADAPIGQVFVGDMGGGKLEPLMRSGGMSLSPQDARQFALMVSAATDIPETMLLGDPSTGNLATATTLDRPTELGFEHRRRLWTGVYDRVCQHAIDAAAVAPGGVLTGRVGRDQDGRREVVLSGETDRSVAVDWPPLQERDMGEIIKALVGSAGGAINIPEFPPAELLRIALSALDVDGVDEIVAAAQDALERGEDERDEQDNQVVEALGELREAIAASRVDVA